MKLQKTILLAGIFALLFSTQAMGQRGANTNIIQVVATSGFEECDGEIDLVPEEGMIYALFSVPEQAFEAQGLPFMDLCAGAYAIRVCDGGGVCKWLQEVVVPVGDELAPTIHASSASMAKE